MYLILGIIIHIIVNSQIVFLIMKLCGICIFKSLNQRPSPRLTCIQVILIPIHISIYFLLQIDPLVPPSVKLNTFKSLFRFHNATKSFS